MGIYDKDDYLPHCRTRSSVRPEIASRSAKWRADPALRIAAAYRTRGCGDSEPLLAGRSQRGKHLSKVLLKSIEMDGDGFDSFSKFRIILQANNHGGGPKLEKKVFARTAAVLKLFSARHQTPSTPSPIAAAAHRLKKFRLRVGIDSASSPSGRRQGNGPRNVGID